MKALETVSLLLTLLYIVFSTTSAMLHYSLGDDDKLNVFPQEEINIVDRNVTEMDGPSIIEKRVIFPNLAQNSLPGQVLGHFAGYYKIKHSRAARMFYFFFESRSNNKKDPLLIWLSGGPGCGSELSIFRENGPVIISDDLSLKLNEYGWDKVSNLLYVDQPIGTGFSYTSDVRDIRHSEVGASNDLYDFLQAFFTEHYELANNDFYITGESYAGHFVPALATRILRGNEANEGIYINLKGMAIGNGLTDPGIQFCSYPDYAYYMKLINAVDHYHFKKSFSLCQKATKFCGTNGIISCVAAYKRCNAIFDSLVSTARIIDVYDIRKNSSTDSNKDNFSDVLEFLKQRSVRDALGVGDINFVPCSREVYENMIVDVMRNLEVGIPALLESGVKLLIYAGEYDLLCNWIGNLRWVEAMNWSYQTEFLHSREVPFIVDGTKAGILKCTGSLSFLKVFNAGHNVPADQPKISLEVLRRWIKNGFKAELGGAMSNASSISFF